ncbi:ZIP family metal transporter [Adonisia turfae]
MLEVVIMTLLAGLAIPAGGFLAMIERVRPLWLERELRHAIIAFGGGVLLSAVSLVLVPEGAAALPASMALAMLIVGGIVFMAIDHGIKRMKGSAGQLIAMLADFVPEAIALGAVFATSPAKASLLAVLIGLQNLPEGFNAYREMRASTRASAGKIVVLMSAMALLGPAAGVAGHLVLRDEHQVVGAIMLFAAGGILFLTFEDIAPQAELENKVAPAFGAVLGFAAGLAGHFLIQP